MKRALAGFVLSAIAVFVSTTSACSPSPSPVTSSSTDAGSGRTCGIGTITQPDSSCVPAEFAVACAAGFAPDPSGYGCRDVLPTDPCTGATRAALGQTTCVPVGDCSAAFPPTNATLFVSASGSTDATHFTTIGAAVAAASPAAVIAVDSGTYAESVQISQSVSIIGKCAANVIIDGSSGGIVQGVSVNGANPVSISGITIHGAFIGLSVEPKGVLTLSHSILDSNYGVGISMESGTGNATLDDVVIRNTQGQTEPGFGINEQASSVLAITNTELTGNHDTALRVSSNSKVTIANSVISHTSEYTGYEYGRGLVVQSGGSADVSTTTFFENMENGIVLNAATAKLTQIVVRDTNMLPGGAYGRGIDAFDQGNFTLDSSTISNNHDAGIIIVNSTATVTKTVVQNTQLNGSGTFGRGFAVQEGSHLTMEGCAILQSHESGMAIFSANTIATISKTFIQGTLFNGDGTIGYGIVGIDGPAMTVQNSEIDSCAGTGLAFAGAAGILASSVISNNSVGIATTDDITLQEDQAAPSQVVANTAVVTRDTQFIANQTRAISGTIPLPTTISQ
ncbi:MAG: right-handed parallel beta-helix repeat-containing protein [Polyangiaceae bacterium]